MDIHNGHLHAPYFIFIKSASDLAQESEVLSDDDLIKSLILACQKPIPKESAVSKKHDVYVTKTGKWIHIMDDWSYSLWHNPNIREWVEKLSKKREIFICAAGELDDAHEWSYFKNGNLQRSVAYENNSSGKLDKKIDVGIPLEGEWKAGLEEDVLDKVLRLAQSIGISIEQNEAEIWSYSFLNGKVVNTKEVFKRQEQSAAERREAVKIKRGGKQILLGLFALTLLIIFGGYHYFNEEALANRLAEEERVAFEELMNGPAGEKIKRNIYLEKIKYEVTTNNKTSIILHLDSIYLDSLPSNFFSLQSIQELTILPSSIIENSDIRKYQLKSISENFTKLTNLKKLILESHHISEIPESLVALDQMELLNLRGNKISTTKVEKAKLTFGRNCRIEY